MLYDKMLLEKQRLEKEIRYMERKLKLLPEGRLVCTGTKEHPKYYCYVGKVKKYIRKRDYRLVEQLAAKKFFTERVKDYRRQLEGVEAYLKKNDPMLNTAPKLLKENSPCSRPLAAIFRPQKEELAKWAAEPYRKSTYHPEQLRHDTVNGLKVRSKSEAMIAMLLAEYKIPFRYEDQVYLCEIGFHPDFTIRHPKTGEIFYWEHFGFVENPKYQRDACERLQLYMCEKIYPSVNLIITWETREKPLTISEIRYKIQKYFF